MGASVVTVNKPNYCSFVLILYSWTKQALARIIIYLRFTTSKILSTTAVIHVIYINHPIHAKQLLASSFLQTKSNSNPFQAHRGWISTKQLVWYNRLPPLRIPLKLDTENSRVALILATHKTIYSMLISVFFTYLKVTSPFTPIPCAALPQQCLFPDRNKPLYKVWFNFLHAF